MDLLENEAEESSGSDSETEHGREKHTKKRAVIDSDDEEEGKSFVYLFCQWFISNSILIKTSSRDYDEHYTLEHETITKSVIT